MAMRSPAGFISAFFDPLKNPDAPTSPSASGGDASASVSFTAPANVGGSAITAYYAVANDGTTGNAATSPVTVSGLINGTSYTFSVWALNSYGPGVFSATTNSVTPALQRGIFGMGNVNPSPTSVINYININSTGNGTSFGTLTAGAWEKMAGCASTTRGLFAGGNNGGSFYGGIQYITIATTGDSTNFGNLVTGQNSWTGGCASTTRGLFGGGDPNSSANRLSTISYVTIATTGNSLEFGNMLGKSTAVMALSSSTTGLFKGISDFTSSVSATVIATLGNATNWGSLLSSANGGGATCSSSTRGIFATFLGNTSNIQYVTIATTGSATAFGFLATPVDSPAGCSNATRGVIGGGVVASVSRNTLQYLTIATTGNTTAFGEMIYTASTLTGFSNCGGGTQ